MGFFAKLFGKKEEPVAKPDLGTDKTSASAPDDDDDWENMSGVPQELNAMEVLKLYESENPPILLDVREPHELQSNGFIPGSTHIPMNDIPARMDELNKEDTIIVYCASGMRSMDVGALLLENGFRNVSNLAGGIHVWQGPKENA